MIDELAREDTGKVLDNAYRFHLALIGNGSLKEDSFKSAQSNAQNLFFDLMGTIRPWEGSSAEERKNQEIEALRARYIERFGDPDDPEFQAEMQRQLEIWQASDDALRNTEDDMERIDRLRSLRDARLQNATRQQGS